jgi:KUP system potassium uptake protein
MAGDRSSGRAGIAALTVGALGVVFGDIGTSPLYALKAAFSTGQPPLAPTQAAVYGVVSLVFWTITLVVSVKYVAFIMRADNDGEGGIMALAALVAGAPLRSARAKAAFLGLGIVGASLFYGDGMITPAISVLSAVEGLDVATPSLSSLVVPIALVVLVMLFGIQRFGTGVVGSLFGPVMAVWFAVMAAIGLPPVIDHPHILRALSPAYGIRFLAHGDVDAFVALASVVLTVTGAEALYADVGHFGRRPIRLAWALAVFPSLIINYMGQGALVLSDPRAIDNPFFRLVPDWGRIPAVVLATMATVIASQAVISGAFSLTHQAVQLGYLPRLTIRHTSAREPGQVYAPAVNWLLCVAVAALVVGFGSSTRLAAAYGIAVTGTMAITTILFLVVVRTRWRRPMGVVVALAAVFLAVDLTLFSASLTKVPHGGWLPVCVAAVTFTILSTWHRGAEIAKHVRIREEGRLREFVDEVRAMDPPVYRAPGTAVFVGADRDTTPLALRANLEHNHTVHRSVVIVVMRTLNVPYVDPADRLDVDDLGYGDDGITYVLARCGFREPKNLPAIVAEAAAQHRLERSFDADRASFFVSRVTLVATPAPGMRRWRKRLFIALARNEGDPIGYLGLPDERTVTMGSVIEL